MHPKDTREELRRRQAKEDFVALGHERSVDRLWKQYVLDAQNGLDVPTRNRTQIYNWSKWDHWEDNAKARLGERIDDQQKAVEDFRKLGVQRLGLLTEKAVETIAKMMDGGDKVALTAATEVLDRVGIVKFDSKTLKKEPDSVPQAAVPDPDSPDEVLQKFLADRTKGT